MIVVTVANDSADRVASLADEGGLPPPIKEDVVEAVGTFLARPSTDEGAPAQTFFAESSTCHTTRHLIDKIRLHQHAPPNARHPRRHFNPSEYRITEIVVLKRRLPIQHEGFVFLVHHEPTRIHTPFRKTKTRRPLVA